MSDILTEEKKVRLLIFLLIIPLASANIYKEIIAENTYQFSFPYNKTNETAIFNFMVNYKSSQEKLMFYENNSFKTNLTDLKINDIIIFAIDIYKNEELINNTETERLIWDIPKSSYQNKIINQNELLVISGILLFVLVLFFIKEN